MLCCRIRAGIPVLNSIDCYARSYLSALSSNRMQKISESYSEYRKRWRKIERVCDFAIAYSPSATPTRLSQHDPPLPGTHDTVAQSESTTLSPWASSSSLSSLVEGFDKVSPVFAAGKAGTLPSMPQGSRKKSNSLPNTHAFNLKQSSDSAQELTTWMPEDAQSFRSRLRQRNDQSGNGRHLSSTSSRSSSSSETDGPPGKPPGFHTSASLPLLRQPSYTEAVRSSSLSLNLLDSEGPIAFSAPSDKASVRRSHDWALDAIREEAGDLGRGGEASGRLTREEGESNCSGSEVKQGRRGSGKATKKGLPRVTGKLALISRSNSSVV